MQTLGGAPWPHMSHHTGVLCAGPVTSLQTYTGQNRSTAERTHTTAQWNEPC